jgi:adenine/guanine/hypoxanthine permease
LTFAARRIPGAILIDILLTAALGIPFGLTHFEAIFAAPPSLPPTLLKLEIAGALSLGIPTLTLMLVEVLDAGTLTTTIHGVGLTRPDGTLRRLREALLADTAGAVLGGAVLGTGTTKSYIGPGPASEAGGRSGLTALVVAFLFLLALLFSRRSRRPYPALPRDPL